MRNFREYDVWQRAIAFVKEIYLFADKLPDKEKYNIISQIQRAAVSISSNIAEGCSRKSEKDFARFIEIALGSAFEVENLVILCNLLEYSDDNDTAQLFEKVHIIQRMLNSLYNKLGK